MNPLQEWAEFAMSPAGGKYLDFILKNWDHEKETIFEFLDKHTTKNEE